MKMTNKHTKGPFHRNIAPAKKYNTIYAGQNTHVAYLATTGLSDEEVEGNANLFAAAPQLLEALENAKGLWAFQSTDASQKQWLKDTEVAIKAAQCET